MNYTTYKPALIAACILGLIAVIIGAFGAHALKKVMQEDLLASFETGVRYQFYHVFALLAVGILYMAFPNPKIIYAAWFFIIGILLFSGSIYTLTLFKSLKGISLGKFGLITPIGGLSFILGWLMLLLGIVQHKS